MLDRLLTDTHFASRAAFLADEIELQRGVDDACDVAEKAMLLMRPSHDIYAPSFLSSRLCLPIPVSAGANRLRAFQPENRSKSILRDLA